MRERQPLEDKRTPETKIPAKTFIGWALSQIVGIVVGAGLLLIVGAGYLLTIL